MIQDLGRSMLFELTSGSTGGDSVLRKQNQYASPAAKHARTPITTTGIIIAKLLFEAPP